MLWAIDLKNFFFYIQIGKSCDIYFWARVAAIDKGKSGFTFFRFQGARISAVTIAEKKVIERILCGQSLAHFASSINTLAKLVNNLLRHRFCFVDTLCYLLKREWTPYLILLNKVLHFLLFDPFMFVKFKRRNSKRTLECE